MAEGFAARHRLLLIASWAQVPLLAGVGLLIGEPVVLVGVACLLTIGLALAGMLIPRPMLAASTTSLALAVASSFLVEFSGTGLLHLYFPVVLVAVAIYANARPLLVALAAISVYHLVAGVWFAGPEGAVWAVLHVGFLALVALTVIVGWRLDTDRDAEIARSNDRYRTSFNAAPIGMATLKLSGQFLETNESLAALLGQSPDHFPGRNIRAVIHTDDMPLLGDAWEAMGNSQTHRASEWMRCLRSDGSAVWTRVTLALVPRTAEQTAMVVLQVEDATSSRREQLRLERLIRGRDEFVASVGDEIRQPLGVLIDLTDADPALRLVNAHAREVASVLDNLIVSARADATPRELASGELDIAAISRRVLDGFPGGESVSIDARARLAWADAELTTQVITSMLGNSIKNGGPRVSVQIYNSGPDTVLRAIDDGPEIPIEQRERVFAGDLRQGQPVTRPVAVGLSLTVGRHLARRMDGDLIYSRSGDGLNIFELRLPSETLTTTFKPRRRPRLSSEITV